MFTLHTQQVEVEIRMLNELGDLTVFVILDSLSKVNNIHNVHNIWVIGSKPT